MTDITDETMHIDVHPDVRTVITAALESTYWSDARARTVSTWWHSFNTSPCPLYKLGSTGYIDGATAPHIESLLADRDHSPEDREDLTHLLAYVNHHGHRQPVPGWDSLWDEAFENERSEDEA